MQRGINVKTLEHTELMSFPLWLVANVKLSKCSHTKCVSNMVLLKEPHLTTAGTFTMNELSCVEVEQTLLSTQNIFLSFSSASLCGWGWGVLVQ